MIYFYQIVSSLNFIPALINLNILIWSGKAKLSMASLIFINKWLAFLMIHFVDKMKTEGPSWRVLLHFEPAKKCLDLFDIPSDLSILELLID